MKAFERPDVSLRRFLVEDVLTTSSGDVPTTSTTSSGPINPELPPDDDFE